MVRESAAVPVSAVVVSDAFVEGTKGTATRLVEAWATKAKDALAASVRPMFAVAVTMLVSVSVTETLRPIVEKLALEYDCPRLI
ncbi:hypothetical protein L6R49_14945 [Myxococcota bacterium]|nr:hypothetical protein [Myxococcota bacterium]